MLHFVGGSQKKNSSKAEDSFSNSENLTYVPHNLLTVSLHSDLHNRVQINDPRPPTGIDTRPPKGKRKQSTGTKIYKGLIQAGLAVIGTGRR